MTKAKPTAFSRKDSQTQNANEVERDKSFVLYFDCFKFCYRGFCPTFRCSHLGSFKCNELFSLDLETFDMSRAIIL